MLSGQKGGDQGRGRIIFNVQTLRARGRKNYFMALYCTSYPSFLAEAAAAAALLKGLFILSKPQAHCVALSLDLVWPRQPVTLRLSMEYKLHRCTAQ